jgi:hypothetical protein
VPPSQLIAGAATLALLRAADTAKGIGLLLIAERPKPFYAVGGHAPLVFALRRMLPRTVMEQLITRRYGLRSP